MGHKLALQMAEDERITQTIAGANSAEEIPNVIFELMKVVEQISLSMAQANPGNWLILFNAEDENHIHAKTIQPFVEFGTKKNHHAFPPVLNETNENFFSSFSEHYLFSLLYSIFYDSIYAENTQRLYHLNSALEQLDKQREALAHSLNWVRQEEITEEIEVIMLNVEAILRE